MTEIPDRDRLLAYLRDNPGAAGKRDIARAFNLKGAQRVALRDLLREMTDEGLLEKRARRVVPPGHLPPVAVLVAGEPDAHGDLHATPETWTADGPPPRVLILETRRGETPGPGDRLLTRLTPVRAEDHAYEGRVIKRLGAGGRRVLGVFRADPGGGGRIAPISKGQARDWQVAAADAGDAQSGDLVEAEALPSRHGRELALPRARVRTVLGSAKAPGAFSLMAMHEQGIPEAFPEDVEAEAEGALPVALDAREDLRHLPLLTIDPADARDHDDAVCALPDPDGAGHIVWIAIADVAHYVRPGTALDAEARRRGNSTYFPDRVAPMLPESLSADLCSLKPGQDRACIALEIRLGPDGAVRSHRFTRGLMRSAANLTYSQAQALADGAEGPMAEAIRALYAAYAPLAAARDARAPLALDLPERRIELGPDGAVQAVGFRERLEAHRLIEAFMVLANVCAAETLEAKRSPLIYRVHEEPGPDKLDALREVAESCGFTLAKGQVAKPALFNRLLAQAAGTDFAELVNLSVLRAQTQAYYAPENLGHFGLALRAYAHFTSPIRRYADLVVHRALISAHRWGPDPRADGLDVEAAAGLRETAEHISFTERRSMTAERDAADRYLAAYLQDRVGSEFEGRISGVTRFGLFVKLDETGADGLIPIGSLGREWFRHDATANTLTGEETGRVLGLGQRVTVRLAEAAPVSGGLSLELLAVEGEVPRPPRRAGRGQAGRPKLAKSRLAAAKAARKTKRSR